MDHTIDRLEELLREGMNSSRQASYRRRAPDSSSVPDISAARDALVLFLELNQNSERAWRLLMLAEESLLDYRAARHCLERAMRLSGRRDKKDLKRLAQYRESETEWNDLGLDPQELAQLGEYLRENVDYGMPDRSLRLTRAWLREHTPQKEEEIVAALRRRGGHSDAQVLSNIVMP